MKKVNKLLSICLVLIMLSGLFALPFGAASARPTVKAGAYAVMDALTGQILVEKDMNKRYIPTNLTKIMTVALVLENLELDRKLTVKDSAVNDTAVPRDTTYIGLIDGEIMPVKDLLYATMLSSANDASNVLAEGVSGSVGEFVKLMNKKAKELGCKNTTFVNANGVTVVGGSNNVSTAYDMALITKYAVQNAYFKQLISQVTFTGAATNKHEEREFTTAHKMLKQTDFYYSFATGGNIGYTEGSKYCAMTVAEQQDKELICIVLDEAEGDNRYRDTEKLFDYCFKNFRYESVTQKDVPSKEVDILSADKNYVVGKALLTLPGEVKFLLHSDLKKTDLIYKDNLPEAYVLEATNGEVFITVKTDLMYSAVASSYLQAASESLSSPIPVPTEEEKEKPKAGNIVKTVLKVIGIILLVLVGGIVILIIYSFIMNNIRRKKRRERRRAERDGEKLSEEKRTGRKPVKKTEGRRTSRRDRGEKNDER